MFASILGPRLHMTTTNTADFDKFNRCLEGKALIVINEMIPLSRDQWAHLRGVVTDETIRIEAKGLDARTVTNVANVVVLSNIVDQDLFPDVGTFSRRICLFHARNVIRKEGRWERFWKWAGREMGQTSYADCDGSRALADFLYNWEIKESVNVIPKSEDGEMASYSGLNPIHQWITCEKTHLFRSD